VLIQKVATIMREVADAAIMPRFRRLMNEDIRTKSPGEEVTVADVEAEQLLSQRLAGLLPGSIVIGEEAAARQPDLVAGLGNGTIWLVDPLDGTSNFIERNACFSMMVAQIREGEVTASWMLSPVSGALHIAEKGAGAWVDGVPARVGSAPEWNQLRGAVLTRFLPPELRETILSNAQDFAGVLPGLRCAGEEYPAIVRGNQSFAVFWRTLPWDHASGVLFLEEAGGKAARFDGTSYRVTEPGFGILAAQTPELWSELHSRLLGG